MRYWTPKHFAPQELLPPEVYKAHGSVGLLAFDPRILWTLDAVRDHYGRPILVNNWHAGGSFKARGFRVQPIGGADLSQHLFGRAVDFDIAGVSAEQFRADARKGKLATALQYVTRIEDGVNWNHIDCAAVPGSEIVYFRGTLSTGPLPQSTDDREQA